MQRKSIKSFYGALTIGLERGYKKIKIEESEVISFLQAYQALLIKDKNIYLSASVFKCHIVLSGQFEPHLTIRFINYPKFELEEKVLKYEIENLSIRLMSIFEQNRIVIEYLDEVLMLENSENSDPRILEN